MTAEAPILLAVKYIVWARPCNAYKPRPSNIKSTPSLTGSPCGEATTGGMRSLFLVPVRNLAGHQVSEGEEPTEPLPYRQNNNEGKSQQKPVWRNERTGSLQKNSQLASTNPAALTANCATPTCHHSVCETGEWGADGAEENSPDHSVFLPVHQQEVTKLLVLRT